MILQQGYKLARKFFEVGFMTDEIKIPEGLTCADCTGFKRCALSFGVGENNTRCFYFPIRFVNREQFPTITYSYQEPVSE